MSGQELFEQINRYGKIYLEIKDDHYHVIFHNLNHLPESELTKVVYPQLNLLEQWYQSHPIKNDLNSCAV